MPDPKFYISKSTGEKELFDLQKLEHSLRKAHASPETIAKITSRIIEELDEEMTTHEIYKQAFELLHKIQKGAALRYSLKRAILELGPSGFPFEKFVAEIFKHKGYQTLTDQIAKGHCVDHEVDVVAWKHHELLMVEAKFHNQLGLKSDLKVVLYVKSRFDDLAKSAFKYGGQDLILTDGILVTNTKFTISAIKYAECQGMKIIGWNYPLDGNLQDFIEEAHLHPITCLNSLTSSDKKILLENGIVLCKSLHEKSVREMIGLTEERTQEILDEVHQLSTPKK